MLLTSCVSFPSGLAASTTPVAPGAYKVLGHAEGKSGYFSLLAVLPFGHPDYNTAIQNAVSKYSGGTALINVRSYSSVLYLYLFSISEVTVEGDVIGN